MPSILVSASRDEFKTLSYMVEVYWLALVWQQMKGTMIFMSTGASNVYKDYRFFEVFFIPSVGPASILGRCREGLALGILKDIASLTRFIDAGDMRLYLELTFPRAPMYHGWCGYSSSESTITPVGSHPVWACDWYWQEPSMYMTGEYNWNILQDVSDPAHWYLVTTVKLKGTRIMEDPGPSKIRAKI